MKDSTIICKDCLKLFSMSEKELCWYIARGWKIPKRCPACRKERREHPEKLNTKTTEAGFGYYATLMQSGVIMKRSTKLNTDDFRGFYKYQTNIVF